MNIDDTSNKRPAVSGLFLCCSEDGRTFGLLAFGNERDPRKELKQTNENGILVKKCGWPHRHTWLIFLLDDLVPWSQIHSGSHGMVGYKELSAATYVFYSVLYRLWIREGVHISFCPLYSDRYYFWIGTTKAHGIIKEEIFMGESRKKNRSKTSFQSFSLMSLDSCATI